MTSPPRRRRAKIVATLGPATAELAAIEDLFRAGADVFRINFSHGTAEDHATAIGHIRRVERSVGRPIAILADLQGPKVRIGRFAAGHVVLQPGRRFGLDMHPRPGDGERVQLPHPEVLWAAQPGALLLLDDGRIRLEVVRRLGDRLETRVVAGGRLSDHKGVNLPGVALPIPALTAKDREDAAFALEQEVDYLGLSFVQRPEDLDDARAIVGDRMRLLAKIEKPQALDHLEEILSRCDAVMLARGDLGVELPPEDVPLIQKRLIRAAQQLGRPVVIATQMLESMTERPAPTRAEASDVATAIFDGADAVMLSAETAAGRFPLESVQMMDRILFRIEGDPEALAARDALRPASAQAAVDALAIAARHVAETIGATQAVAFTETGATALRLARQRPGCPILGLTPSLQTARSLALVWGVQAQRSEAAHTMAEAIGRAAMAAARSGVAKPGDGVVVVGGVPFGRPGGSNFLRITECSVTGAASA